MCEVLCRVIRIISFCIEEMSMNLNDMHGFFSYLIWYLLAISAKLRQLLQSTISFDLKWPEKSISRIFRLLMSQSVGYLWRNSNMIPFFDFLTKQLRLRHSRKLWKIEEETWKMVIENIDKPIKPSESSDDFKWQMNRLERWVHPLRNT